MRDLEEVVEDQMKRLQERADEVATSYWNFRNRENDRRPTNERTNLGVRANIKGGAVRIEWFRTRVYVRRDGEAGRPYSDYIKKGRRNRYPRNTLARNAQSWEEEYVQKCEDEFALIREQAAELVQLRKSARNLRKRGGLRFLATVETNHQEPDDPTEGVGNASP